jgi:5-methylthioadenosine/S-adenosylhomocysteine deaminase
LRTLIKDALIVTMDRQGTVEQGNLLVENDKIAYRGPDQPQADLIISGAGKMLIPGLVQTHVHLPQAIFAGRLTIWNF